jgi:hypothetical protein
MTKDEARLYLNLLDVAWSEGLADDESFELGKKLRDEHFPDAYDYIFEPRPAKERSL